ncbi:unnamed protein product [Bursaphelenchus okinawaensis]|uniref:SUMO-activating enzyme subunit n=1 Tax=Bursaphelenchus okinawaensis TaxID=465554 RepID=A0A811KXK6_9BILA|nr:unnamed protein product [Bursaphelenchus okinawaensis]CAG9113318.1 unnamed protein product [Bursaphelenchus okinawaensis]
MPHAYYQREFLESRLLVVGAGGIGCELLKNLVIAGFVNIEVIDLDTIDVSNLNRQFLFRKEHVGKPKAQVAAEAVKKMRPEINIVHHHDSIFSPRFDRDYFKSFKVVLNALDNAAARRHVNRICITTGTPLIDGGTAGYLGQCRVIQRGKTECYDCVDHPPQRTFAGCTIRNTPSEFIHCIMWSKALFSQLYGDADPDDDVAPYEEEERKEGEETKTSPDDAKGDLSKSQMNTRAFATKHDYNPKLLYDKLFVRDIEYLLRMENLWKDRRPPEPFRIDDMNAVPEGSTEREWKTNEMWPIEKWVQIFAESLEKLTLRFKEAQQTNKILSWDKDDEDALNFVAACSNIRSHVFGINGKSVFDVKSMAGNIIPAIATTNAIIAGMMVVETYKVLGDRPDTIQSMTYLQTKPNFRGKIFVNECSTGPNPNCYVCADQHEASVRVNVEKMTVKTFVNSVITHGLGFLEPDVTDMLSGRIVYSSEDGMVKSIENSTLESLNVKHGAQLDCDDFRQHLNIKVFIVHDPNQESEEYKIENNTPSSVVDENKIGKHKASDDVTKDQGQPVEKRARIET